MTFRPSFKLKRPGITAQLFLAVLAIAGLVALAMGAAARFNFQRGFIDFLNAQAVARMEAALPRLQQAHAQHGSWDFVRDRPEVWFNLIGAGLRPPPPGSPPPQGAERAMISSDLLGAGRRLTLLDAQRQRIIGFPLILAGTVQREIVVDGRTVGWLAIAPLDTVTEEAELSFQTSQLRASLLMGGVALLAAALIAWWVARSLLKPVREVAAATHRLAAGAHDTRVPVRGHDEVAQLAQDFNQLALTLERNERMRRDFMADVSHELRTPLAVLRGELEALEDGVHQPTPENLRLLQAEVAALTQLVGDLHELALADVGALSYHKTDLDLAQLLRGELAQLRHRCDEHGLALQAELPAQPLPLLADAPRLRQLLHNLFANSLRYTDAGGQLQLRLHSEGDEAVIDLQDSAPGVDAALLPRLFERFFRAEGSRARASGGSGLGLAICRSIATAHGGSISARASPLGGLWMQIRLPRLRRGPDGAPR
ncbi:MAG: HAMP domain-containing protein [Burkholderiaceae bacterium]|nr:HAMP domain-containing protein [Burkholderiaceae bacterium]